MRDLPSIWAMAAVCLPSRVDLDIDLDVVVDRLSRQRAWLVSTIRCWTELDYAASTEMPASKSTSTSKTKFTSSRELSPRMGL